MKPVPMTAMSTSFSSRSRARPEPSPGVPDPDRVGLLHQPPHHDVRSDSRLFPDVALHHGCLLAGRSQSPAHGRCTRSDLRRHPSHAGRPGSGGRSRCRQCGHPHAVAIPRSCQVEALTGTSAPRGIGGLAGATRTVPTTSSFSSMAAKVPVDISSSSGSATWSMAWCGRKTACRSSQVTLAGTRSTRNCTSAHYPDATVLRPWRQDRELI